VPETKREIEELRHQITQVDTRLVALLDERARAARRIRELRADQPAVLPVGDHADLEQLLARSSGDMPAGPLRRVLDSIFAECLAIELPAKVAVAGEEGGPAHAAARGRFGSGAGLIPNDAAGDALDHVARRRAEFAVAPLATSGHGPVHATFAALMASDLRIVEVLEIALDLHLANRSGSLGDVQSIHVTAGDLARCRRTLGELAPQATIVEARSPLSACRMAREDVASAAVALEQTAADAGLVLARHGVVDNGAEKMRLAVVGTRPSGRTGKEITSFVFTVRDGPSSLLDVLSVFAERGIPLTSLHSHPDKTHDWSYVFFAETVGHFTDRPLVMAFEEVKRLTRSFKFLGSYPSP
jgi:chorismate mutase/prephenate dehydratase